MHKYKKNLEVTCKTGTYTKVLITTLCLFFFAGCKEKAVSIEPFAKGKQDNLKNTAELIIKDALSDDSPQIRAKAIEVTADTKQKQLMPQVQKLLRDDFVPVRYNAALAVGDMEYYLAKSLLEKLLINSEENTQLGAAYALYKLGYRQYLENIKTAVKNSDQTVRANAVVLLGKSKDQSVLQLLYWAKDDDYSEPKVRYQATEAIAKLGDERIIPKIWTMLISKYVDNKIIGIRAMGALGTQEAKEVLLTKLDDDILEVRLAAAEQLGLLGNISGQDVVISVFEKQLFDPFDPQERERVLVLAALAIGRINTPQVTKYLPRLIADQSKLVKLAAAQAVLLNNKVR